MNEKEKGELKDIDESLYKDLDKIEFSIDDFFNRRISHNPFQKIFYWLWVQSKKSDFIYANELAKFTKLSKPRSFNILNELCNAGFLYKKYSGNLVEYWFIKNSDHAILDNYIDKVKKKLGL